MYSMFLPEFGPFYVVTICYPTWLIVIHNSLDRGLLPERRILDHRSRLKTSRVL